MIITANGNVHTVSIAKSFSPSFSMAVKFEKNYNGKIFVSDRGADFDKYACTVNVIGDIDDIDILANDLNSEKGQLLIDTQGMTIFGSGVDHSTEFTCNYRFNKYPIVDMKTAAITLELLIVSEIIYNSAVTAVFPKIYYQYDIARSVVTTKNIYDSMEVGEYGVSVRTDVDKNIISRQDLGLNLSMKDAEFAKMHKYIATNRGTPFNLITNSHFEPFLASISTSVIVTDFTFAPDGFNFWNVSLTLVKN